MALFSWTTWVSRYQKGKPIWILLKQGTVSSSGISWAICKSAPHSRQTTIPTPHHSVLQAGCPSCHPINSVEALKAVCASQCLNYTVTKLAMHWPATRMMSACMLSCQRSGTVCNRNSNCSIYIYTEHPASKHKQYARNNEHWIKE